MNEFSQVKEAVDGVELALADMRRRVRTKCSWDDPEDVALYKVDRRLEERNNALRRLVPKRICPICENEFLLSKSWVVNRMQTKAVCMSCYTAKQGGEAGDIFTNPRVRYDVDGVAFIKTREMYGVSRGRFAALVGWSSNRQQQLETGNVISISEEIVLRIIAVFDQLEK